MVLNTRNFLLYLLCVGFLIIAITTTALKNNTNQTASVAMAPTVSGEIEYKAEAVVVPVLDRQAMISSMREKVQALGVSTISAPDVVADETEEVPPVPVVRDGEFLCADYQIDDRLWKHGQVEFKVVEGARIMYRQVEVTSPETNSTGTVTYLDIENLLQLPLQALPLASESCLKSDVIGVALDGSLIRNNEFSIYSIFGSETLFGYALDGFPIYGTETALVTDNCGGAVVDGQYRYYLKPERQAVLNCFAGIPVSL